MAMDSPFFRSYWGGMPPEPRHAPPSVHRDDAKTKPSKKVISIPVHFVGSDRSRSDSALKIQKVLRGFLVRKNIKKIAAIRNEVDEIERGISVEQIKTDAKERLRVNETLMNLLLGLDSVRSVDSGVRDFRKSVIKKAIALQEQVDQIVSAQIKDSIHCSLQQNLELPAPTCANISVSSEGPRVAHLVPNSEVASETPELEAAFTHTVNPLLEVENEEKKMKIEGKDNYTEEIATSESADESHTGELSGTSTAAGTSLVKGMGESSWANKNNGTDMIEVQSDEPERHPQLQENSQNGNRELLERMMEDNERMMGLMAQLVERNELQTKLLSSLSHRVEQLEKAFVCEKLRKKKRRSAAAAVDKSHIKKCDKGC